MRYLRSPYDRITRYALIALALLALFASGHYSGRIQGERDERIRMESARSLRADITAKKTGLDRSAR